jgi:hypothetical protein
MFLVLVACLFGALLFKPVTPGAIAFDAGFCLKASAFQKNIAYPN